jgi:fibronectin type 3 domain-containing protein
MCDNKFEKINSDSCVFVKRYSNGDFIILLLYVDDVLVVESDLKKIKALKERLESEFVMKDLGAARQIIEMRITRNRKDRKLWLSQEKYIENVLQRFNMDMCKSVTSPLANHFKLSHDGCPKVDKEKEEIKKCAI